MLSELLNKDKTTFSYEEIEEQVNNLYGQFSVSQKVQYPFWRLRNDNILTFENEKKISVNPSGDASVKDLRHYGTAKLNEEIVTTARRSPAKLVKEIYNMLEQFFIDSLS